MTFEFATAQRIIFGPESNKQIAPLAKPFGKRVLFICGRSKTRTDAIKTQLKEQNLTVVPFQVTQEPSVEIITQAAELARKQSCDTVIAIGGGSVLDTGKAAAVLAANPGDLYDYLEVVGRGNPLQHPALPCIAVPTTAGTGTEVTKNSVIRSPEHGVKVSLRSNFMYPAIALVDPVLTYSLPPELTVTTGLDAFTQLIEAFVSIKANPFTDALCREGIKRINRALPRVFKNGNDSQAREDMCLASLLSGLALANAKLGAVHGFAGPLGGMINAAHGAICASLLAYTIEINVKALTIRAPESPQLTRFKELAELITGRPSTRAEDAVVWIKKLCSSLAVPRLQRLGLDKKDFDVAVKKAKNSSSMKGNPIILTDDELLSIIRAAY
jgi:alcohol dehydrogenase class IV